MKLIQDDHNRLLFVLWVIVGGLMFVLLVAAAYLVRRITRR